MILSVLFLGLVFLPVVPSLAEPTGTRCPPAPGRSETCVCKSDKGIIDVTPLSQQGGGPRFSNLRDPNGYTYFYNPCHSYNAGPTGCDVVYICSIAGLFSYDIAYDFSEEMWIDDDGTPYLYYTGVGGRETKVFLYCNESVTSPVVTTDGDTKITLHYVFHVTAKEVCPTESGGGGGSGGKGGSKSGYFSTGLAVAIVFIAMVVSAVVITGSIVVGIVVYRKVKKWNEYSRVN